MVPVLVLVPEQQFRWFGFCLLGWPPTSGTSMSGTSRPILGHSGPKKKQPKHKVCGQDIPGTSGTQTSGYPGRELYASGLVLLF